MALIGLFGQGILARTALGTERSYAFKCHRDKVENQTLIYPAN
ncbi:hypothetical protein PF005_g24206 [Phytophthora fragariae]|uniref:Uncharacterized protein n=2 Tax=Phytophthora TaxID=4783 RepID=A0A6A3HMK8_9STRA|nr:hypothetical protein PF003_g26035 [Phytophthora fragariae]KAE8961329.1 hypothetical protein PR001_g30075 [Phytophthora rubi]KAE8924767.1 hypothetical protein PF009_g25007 [Phytophthora fragariae]KAE8971616.1 hypothetical protein PF011_g25969 [Phytophthora fragariae]KAE9067425.1 hypothetical protein PF006_g30004 [Phytophthora fragariae]